MVARRMHGGSHTTSGGFTLIEILVVVGIIALLAAHNLPNVVGAQNRYRKTQTQQLVNDLGAAIDIYALANKYPPAPDDSCFIEYDTSIDDDDLAQLAAIEDWPVLNKLSTRQQFSFAFESLIDGSTADRKRMADAWQQPIRYLRGSEGPDDHGHTPEGLIDGWNYDAEQGEILRKQFPYIYSYGPVNDDGSDLERWIYNGWSEEI
jgi:prepilin-type N-terminal cleavage/methylation domain-containing protein